MQNPQFSIKFDTKANVYVAYSHEENVYSQGRTAEESLLAIQSAVDMVRKVKKEREARL